MPFALGQVERDFAQFLYSERGLKPATVGNYQRTVRHFLMHRFGRQEPRLDELRLHDIHRFILERASHVRRSYAKLMVTALRSFLRFLHQRGAITVDLAAAVPAVANWRLSHLPMSLTSDQVERLLTCCDRSTLTGQRDFAILLFLSRLGLRAGEVVAMTLDDFDWQAGEFVVHGKGDRQERLPLPQDVGSALVHYLRHVRPPCRTRRVFVRIRAPRCGFSGSAAICDVVRRALARAGFDPAFKGAHLLRHSLATNMLRKGASLDEIGQLLRHVQTDNTQIYAKVEHPGTARYRATLAGRHVMSTLRTSLSEYLGVRRALGVKLREPGRMLQRFVDFAEHAGATYITTELALQWATQPESA